MHETEQTIGRSFFVNYLPIAVAVLSVMALWGMKEYGIKIPTSMLPWPPFRIDFVDAIYGTGLWFLVSWHGWVFATPFLCALLLKSGPSVHCWLFVITLLGTCFLNTFLDFSNPSVEIFVMAIGSYPIAFLPIAGVIVLLKILILRSIYFSRRLFNDYTNY